MNRRLYLVNLIGASFCLLYPMLAGLTETTKGHCLNP